MSASGRRRAALVAGGWIVAPASLLAHTLASEAPRHWTWEPYTIALIWLSLVIYGAGTAAVWRRAGVGRGLRRWQVFAFATGLMALAIALLSPLAWLSEILFSAHMTQHEILVLVAAPLLAFGEPLFAVLWAVPPAMRERWGRLSQRRGVKRAWRQLTGPFVVFLLHALALWIWHAPTFYEAALHNQGIHALEHLSFVATAALFWWAMIHGRYGRTGYGVAVLYVFLTGVHSGVLGALMTVAPRVLYPAYALAGRAWNVDILEDQQLAGLLMWVPSGLVFIVFGLALFAAWLGESDKRVALGSMAPRPTFATGEHDDGR
jgi:cytochrome c oxidase assembly factor CtaG